MIDNSHIFSKSKLGSQIFGNVDLLSSIVNGSPGHSVSEKRHSTLVARYSCLDGHYAYAMGGDSKDNYLVTEDLFQKDSQGEYILLGAGCQKEIYPPIERESTYVYCHSPGDPILSGFIKDAWHPFGLASWPVYYGKWKAAHRYHNYFMIRSLSKKALEADCRKALGIQDLRRPVQMSAANTRFYAYPVVFSGGEISDDYKSALDMPAIQEYAALTLSLMTGRDRFHKGFEVLESKNLGIADVGIKAVAFRAKDRIVVVLGAQKSDEQALWEKEEEQPGYLAEPIRTAEKNALAFYTALKGQFPNASIQLTGYGMGADLALYVGAHSGAVTRAFFPLKPDRFRAQHPNNIITFSSEENRGTNSFQFENTCGFYKDSPGVKRACSDFEEFAKVVLGSSQEPFGAWIWADALTEHGLKHPVNHWIRGNES